jgi:hypothetical protein
VQLKELGKLKKNSMALSGIELATFRLVEYITINFKKIYFAAKKSLNIVECRYRDAVSQNTKTKVSKTLHEHSPKYVLSPSGT